MTKIAGSASGSGSGSISSEAWIRGSGSTPKCHGSATLISSSSNPVPPGWIGSVANMDPHGFPKICIILGKPEERPDPDPLQSPKADRIPIRININIQYKKVKNEAMEGCGRSQRRLAQNIGSRGGSVCQWSRIASL